VIGDSERLFRRPRPGFGLSRLEAALEPLPRKGCWWIGFSGGCDSSVLLHALSRLRPLSVELRALHVNHRLHPDASAWAEHCRRFAAARGIPFRLIEVDAVPGPGESPEARAREARYAAFAEVLAAGDHLLLAHHRDDQAETVLLRLLRGAGPEGLAGMPVTRPLGAGQLYRPLLDFTRADLQAWARREGLEWIEDPTNAGTDPDRNFLRHEILPRLRSRWPAADAALARAARLQREAADELARQAAADWASLAETQPDRIAVAPLRALPAARQRRLLRYWIGRINARPLPDARHLQRLLDEVLTAAPDAMPEVRWRGARIRRHDGRLWLLPETPPATPPMQPWDLRQPLLLGDGRCLEVREITGEGLRADLRGREDIRIDFRRGGERLRPAGRGERHHALKKLLQEWRVPPWERARLPLLYVGEAIAAVPGYCVCAPFAARAGEAGLVIRVRCGERD